MRRDNDFISFYVFSLKVLWFGDKTSGEIFSLVDNLQQTPVEQKHDIEEKVVDLVQADSVVALRKYIKVPEHYSELVQFLKNNLQVINSKYSLQGHAFLSSFSWSGSHHNKIIIKLQV